jgi:hypothetical protein
MRTHHHMHCMWPGSLHHTAVIMSVIYLQEVIKLNLKPISRIGFCRCRSFPIRPDVHTAQKRWKRSPPWVERDTDIGSEIDSHLRRTSTRITGSGLMSIISRIGITTRRKRAPPWHHRRSRKIPSFMRTPHGHFRLMPMLPSIRGRPGFQGWTKGF